MKNHRLFFATVALLAIEIGLTTTETNANAHSRAVKVPASLRGTWYNYDGTYNKIRATKYHFKTSGSNGSSSFSGVKFPKYASGHADMFVHRTPKGYYNIGKYGTDNVGTFKKVTHKGHAAIKQVWHDLPDTGAHVSYWYKTKAIAKHPTVQYKFRTATSTDFFYDSWEPAYLDQNSLGLDLFSNKKDVYGGYEPDKTIDSFTTKLYAKWVSKTQSNNTIMVKIGSNIYYANDSKHDVRPYNANRIGGTITSHFKPTSKSALLKRGTHIYKGTLWTYSYDNDNHDKGYEFNGHKWVHISYLDV